MQMIWAVIRSSKIDEVIRALKSLGVTGCTVSNVKGYGREWYLYEPEIHGELKKLEIVVEEQRMEEVGRAIIETAWTGLKGDGILAVHDLDHAVEIRPKDWNAPFPRTDEQVAT